MRTQVAIVRSRFVLNAALRDPKVSALKVIREQEDPLEYLSRHIRADFSYAPEIMCISMSGDEPGAIRVILDAVRAAYLNEVVNKEKTARKAHLDELTKICDDYRGQLKAKREKLQQLAEDGRRRIAVAKPRQSVRYRRMIDDKQQPVVIHVLHEVRVRRSGP